VIKQHCFHKKLNFYTYILQNFYTCAYVHVLHVYACVRARIYMYIYIKERKYLRNKEFTYIIALERLTLSDSQTLFNSIMHLFNSIMVFIQISGANNLLYLHIDLHYICIRIHESIRWIQQIDNQYYQYYQS